MNPKQNQKQNSTAPGSGVRRALSAACNRTGVAPIPPSNTIGDNCNPEYFKALRWGVDSLYLTYTGELFPEVLTRLKALKTLAQSAEDNDIALAQYPIGGHVFEVKDRGVKLFPYILADGAFYIQLSTGGRVPMAYVQISSQYLAFAGPELAESALRNVLSQLGNLTSMAAVSRIDLYADFVCPEDMEWGREAWVTRAAGIDRYAENGVFTGWVIGKGGILMARMYYKLLQAAKNNLEYLLPLWEEAGWREGDSVWRLEFQIKREVLKQMHIDRLSDTLKNLGGLWSYATTEWLKLTVPNPDDQTRSRWPVHPLWGYLSSIDWETQGGPLSREYTPTRTPSNEALYVRYLSTLVSFMAVHSHRDFYQAQEAFTELVVGYFSGRAEFIGLSFDGYIAERIDVRRREFNTGINDPELAERIKADNIERRASAYRKARDGN